MFLFKEMQVDKIFFLEWGKSNQKKELSKKESIIELMRFSIPPPNGNDMESDAHNLSEISSIAKMSKSYKIYRKKTSKFNNFNILEN